MIKEKNVGSTLNSFLKEEKDNLKEIEKKYNEVAMEAQTLYNMVNLENKFGRNNLCFCGSRKRFKHCHLDEHIEKETKLHDINMNLNEIKSDYIKLKKENIV